VACKKDGPELFDITLTYTSDYSESIIAYANYGLTESGVHISTVKAGLTRQINRYAVEHNLLKKTDDPLTQGELAEGFYLVFNVKASKIKYDSQTKTRIVDLNKTLINSVINNGEKFVYSDTIPFLKRLTDGGHTVNMLTYTKQESIDYQIQKIKGSGLANFFKNIFIVSSTKKELGLDYKNGIFIDDNPSDLVGLSETNPKDLIRIRRDNNKYSKIEMPDNIKFKEYPNFNQL
jgi:hypothetical protein